LAEGLCDPDSPLYISARQSSVTSKAGVRNKPGLPAKAVIARALELDRTSLYYQPEQPRKDAVLAERIKQIYERDDDTLGSKKLAKLLSQDTDELSGSHAINHKRVARVMATQGIAPRSRSKKWVKPGRAAFTFPNLPRLLEQFGPAWIGMTNPEIVRSDIFEFRLADSSKVYGCFAIREITAQLLSLNFAWRMTAELVATTIAEINIELPEGIWHSDQGSQYGSDAVIDALVTKDYLASMSRAGTPTDNGKAERLVGTVKHSVCRRKPYQSIGELLQTAQQWSNFYNERRPHESLGQLSPNAYAAAKGLEKVPYLDVLMC
jgi:transposase InsO family protein